MCNSLEDALIVATKMVIIDPKDSTTDYGDFRLALTSPKTKLRDVAKAHVGSGLAASTHPIAGKDPVESFLVCINRDFAVDRKSFSFPKVKSKLSL